MIEFWTASAKPLQRLSSAAAAVDAAAGHDRYHDLVAIVIVMPPDGVEEAHCCRPLSIIIAPFVMTVQHPFCGEVLGAA